jgi:hypothetical protein
MSMLMRIGWIIAAVMAACAVMFPVTAAVDPTSDPKYAGLVSGDLDQWQRIDVRSAQLSVQNAPQFKVSIRTRGPSMQGLIRIPGAPASNFDTGNGVTVVDLINVSDNAGGYAEIIVLEILFTQRMPNQFYEAFAIDEGDHTE